MLFTAIFLSPVFQEFPPIFRPGRHRHELFDKPVNIMNSFAPFVTHPVPRPHIIGYPFLISGVMITFDVIVLVHMSIPGFFIDNDFSIPWPKPDFKPNIWWLLGMSQWVTRGESADIIEKKVPVNKPAGAMKLRGFIKFVFIVMLALNS